MMMAAVLLLMPVSAWAGSKAVVTSRSMKVYRSKNSAAGKLPQGTIVKITAKADGVAEINYKGKTGYALLEDLKALKQTEVCMNGATVHISASKKTRSVSVKKGTKVNLVGVSGGWACIEKDGKIGYIEKENLAEYATGRTEALPATEVDALIGHAKTKLGCKYVYGNSGPDKFDCSGFTKYVYKLFGVSLSGSAYGQGYGKGEKVAYDNVKKGDIVCFNTVETDTDLVDHVGVYIGGGQFIHASSSRGEVIISSMSSGYYKRVFSWGRRVL